MSYIDDKLRAIPRMVQEGRLKEACDLASDSLDVAAANAGVRDLSSDSLIILRDLLDTTKLTLTTPPQRPRG